MYIIVFILFIVILHCVSEEEREAFVDFYFSTNGPSWETKELWNSDSNPCSWYGVGCLGGAILSISLPFNSLNGTFPDSFRILSTLTSLNFQKNRLRGGLDVLTNFTRLTSLNIFGNMLSESIPDLTNLTDLSYLNLASNSFYGSIPNFPSSLSHIELWNNHLTGSLPSFPPLLQSLLLNSNELTGTIPQTFSSLVELRELSLHLNLFTGVVPPLTPLTKLTSLFLHENIFSGTIPPLPSSLLNLHLYANDFRGPFPNELSQLTSLQYLELHSNPNFISNFPSYFSGLTSLANLVLRDLELIGTIPSFQNLRDLVVLELNDNQLFGPFPNIENAANLNRLDLSNLQLEGSIPNYLGNLRRLNSVILQNCELIGTIPTNLIQSTSITCLSLGGNFFSETPDYCTGRQDHCCDWVETNYSIQTTTVSQVMMASSSSALTPQKIRFYVALSVLAVALILICVSALWALYIRLNVYLGASSPEKEESEDLVSVPSEEKVFTYYEGAHEI